MSKKNEKRNNTGLGLAVWILAILIILIVFLVKQNEIKSNLKKTNFFEKMFGSTPGFIADHNVETEKLPEEVSDNVIVLKKPEKKTPVAQEPQKVAATSKSDSKETVSKKRDADEKTPVAASPSAKNVPEQKKSESEAKKTPVAVQTPQKVQKTKEPESSATKNLLVTKICFVHYDSDGLVIRKEVQRSVEKDSPLTNSIRALLTGPSAAEKSTGCMTMIPDGTKLLSAVVRSGVAYLDFSDNFEFNTHGVEGYLAQLMQIVYTATEYSSVTGVQILIEGQKKDYLGSEGVWIGSPLSRGSF